MKKIIIFLIMSMLLLGIANALMYQYNTTSTDEMLWLRGDDAEANYGSNNAMTIGYGNGARDYFLVNFSNIISSLPADSTINNISIQLHPSLVAGTTYPADARVYRVFDGEFGEDYSTFSNFGVNMTDYNGTETLMTGYTENSYTLNKKINYTISNDYAQGVYDGTDEQADNGLFFYWVGAGSTGNYARFRSDDHLTASERPIVWIEYELPYIDNQTPHFTDTSIESPRRINDVITISQVITDDVDVDKYRIIHNQTGTFTNQTIQDVTGTAINGTYPLTITLPKNNVIAYYFWATDNSGNENQTAISTFTVENTAPSTPTIISPIADKFNEDPLPITVTWEADPDGDGITAYYYINDTFNQTSAVNISIPIFDGVYKLDVSIYDGQEFSNNASITFEMDITQPFLNVDNPIEATYTNDFDIDISCFDDNIFLLNYTFSNSTDQVESTQVNISSNGYLFINETISITGLALTTYNFTAQCSDSHTKREINDYEINKNAGQKSLKYGNKGNQITIRLIGDHSQDVTDFNTWKETDRYIFFYDFDLVEDGTEYTYRFQLNANSNDIIYLSDSNYNAHFVIPDSQNWVDMEFNGNENAVYEVTKTGNNYFIDITTTKTYLEFESIGGLNIEEESFIITLSEIPPEEADTTFFTRVLSVGMIIAIIIWLIISLKEQLFKRGVKK